MAPFRIASSTRPPHPPRARGTRRQQRTLTPEPLAARPALPARQPTAQNILDVARDLYARGGYAAVTVRAVAEKVGITSGAIYKHFSSKEDLFMSLQEQALALLVDIEGRDRHDDAIEQVRLYFWRYYEFSQGYPEYFRMLWVDSSAPNMADSKRQHHGLRLLRNDSYQRIETCMTAGLFPPGDTSSIARYLWATVHGCAVLQMDTHRAGPDQWVADALDTSLLAVRNGLLQGHHNRHVSTRKPRASPEKAPARKRRSVV